jgi:hypothetical protein
MGHRPTYPGFRWIRSVCRWSRSRSPDPGRSDAGRRRRPIRAGARSVAAASTRGSTAATMATADVSDGRSSHGSPAGVPTVRRRGSPPDRWTRPARSGTWAARGGRRPGARSERSAALQERPAEPGRSAVPEGHASSCWSAARSTRTAHAIRSAGWTTWATPHGTTLAHARRPTVAAPSLRTRALAAPGRRPAATRPARTR